MSFNTAYTEKLPLSVLLFHTAMMRNQSISIFADEIGVSPISLRQFILGKTQRPRQKTIDMIAEKLNISSDEVRQRMDLLPQEAPIFRDWLDEQLRGRFSRAKLTRETKISDGALRNYLSGQTLPDSDQAIRLAEILELDSLEMANMIVANQVVENGGEVAPRAALESNVTSVTMPVSNQALLAPVMSEALLAPSPIPAPTSSDEDHVLGLWRRLHPQGRRATVQFIATLLAEG